MIFKVLEGGEGDNLQKSTASRSKSNNQVDAFRLGATTRCPPRCLPLPQSARIHGQRLKLPKFGSLEPDNSDTFVSSPLLGLIVLRGLVLKMLTVNGQADLKVQSRTKGGGSAEGEQAPVCR
jgi:hypothetical protein